MESALASTLTTSERPTPGQWHGQRHVWQGQPGEKHVCIIIVEFVEWLGTSSLKEWGHTGGAHEEDTVPNGQQLRQLHHPFYELRVRLMTKRHCSSCNGLGLPTCHKHKKQT